MNTSNRYVCISACKKDVQSAAVCIGETHHVIVNGGHVFLKGTEVHTCGKQRQRGGALFQAQKGGYVLINQPWNLEIHKSKNY